MFKKKLWKFFQTKIKAKESKLKTVNIYINEIAIINGALMNEGLPRFGIIIIPDYIAGYENIILAKLGTSGINKIKEYYQNGRIIFATGKSSALLEDFGLIPKNTYNRKYFLYINTPNAQSSTKGCEDTIGKHYSSTEDFKKHMSCLSIKEDTKVTISSIFLPQKNKDSFTTLINMDLGNKDLIVNEAETGDEKPLSDAQKNYLPLISHKSNDKNGQLFLINFNPVTKGSDRQILSNLILLALSKELYLTSNVTMSLNSTEMVDMPIPAGEAGFNLEVNTVFHNLNDKDISNSVLYVFFLNILIGQKLQIFVLQSLLI